MTFHPIVGVTVVALGQAPAFKIHHMNSRSSTRIMHVSSFGPCCSGRALQPRNPRMKSGERISFPNIRHEASEAIKLAPSQRRATRGKLKGLVHPQETLPSSSTSTWLYQLAVNMRETLGGSCWLLTLGRPLAESLTGMGYSPSSGGWTILTPFPPAYLTLAKFRTFYQ